MGFWSGGEAVSKILSSRLLFPHPVLWFLSLEIKKQVEESSNIWFGLVIGRRIPYNPCPFPFGKKYIYPNSQIFLLLLPI